jgi:hypothetical protein
VPPVAALGSPANRSICCGTRRRACVCFVWRGIDLSPILVAREIECARKPGIRWCKTVAQRVPHQLRKGHERRQIGISISSHTHPGAGRPLEHPCWNLKPAVHIGTAQTTTKNNLARPLDRFVNANPKTKPWMPPVQQFAKLSSVGVLKPRCTMRNVRTGRSARRRRLCYSPTLTQPARHREQAGKIYPPAIQSSASVQQQPRF